MKVVNHIFLYSVLIVACVTDIRSNRIPNWLTFSAIITGLGLNTVEAGAGGLVFGIEGLLLGIGVFIIFYLTGGMGAGDVKLMGAVGAVLGPQMTLYAVLASALIGGFYALAVIIFHPRAGATRTALAKMIKELIYFQNLKYDKPQNAEKQPTLCYGVAIALGTIAAVALKG